MFEKDDFTFETRVSDAVMDRIEAVLNDESTDYAALGRALALN